MKKVKLGLRIVLLILDIIIGIFIFASILLLVVVTWPQLVINSTSIGWAAKLAEKKGIHIQWKDLSLRIDSPALLRKKIILDTHNLCFRLEPDIKGCASRLDLIASVSFAKLVPELVDVELLKVEKLEGSFQQEQGKITGIVDLDGNSHLIGKETDYHLSGTAVVRFADHGRVTSDLTVLGHKNAKKNFDAEFNIVGNYKKSRTEVQSKIQGKWNAKSLQVTLEALAKRLVPTIPKIKIESCQINLTKTGHQVKHPSSPGLQISVNCPIGATVPIPPKPFDVLKIPTWAGGKITLDAESNHYPPGLEDTLAGQAKFVFDPLLTPLIQGQGQVDAQFKGKPSQLPNAEKLDFQVSAELLVGRFQKWVQALENTSWAVPAPFHPMKGQVSLKLNGKGTLEKGEFPIILTSRLGSKNQNLDLNFRGLFNYKVDAARRKVHPEATADLELSRIKLELPRLDLAAPPPLFPDSRMKPTLRASKKEKSRSSGDEWAVSPIKYQVKIHTPAQSPLLISSNLAKSLIPIHIGLNLSEKNPVQGKVHFDPFNLEAFRHEAVVNTFDLHIENPMNESPIDGKITMEYADYTMTVQISNSIKKPQVKLFSEPPLPENQLIAALLFGRPLDELDPSESSSVSNTRAAFADGAVNLVSFFALASTPIQSIGYDPTTGSFNAKVRVAEGTSLNIGGGGDTSTVGIRKRLGKSWSVETDVSNSSVRGDVVSAFLQWSRRY